MCITFFHGMQHVLTFWIIEGILKLFINLLVPELFFLILAHPLYKM